MRACHAHDLEHDEILRLLLERKQARLRQRLENDVGFLEGLRIVVQPEEHVAYKRNLRVRARKRTVTSQKIKGDELTRAKFVRRSSASSSTALLNLMLSR